MKGKWPKILSGSGKKSDGGIRQVPIAEIRANPFQPRRKIDNAQLEELARSIQEVGVINPVVLREVDNKYELIAGERRVRASKMAGLETVPAIIKNLSDRETAEVALIENLQREDLNYFEEAQSFAVLIGEFGLTQEEVAQRIGKTQASVANKLRLLKLPERVRENISCDLITERHTRALLKLKSEEMQLEVLRRIYETGLTVRETEELIAQLSKDISREIISRRRKTSRLTKKDIPYYLKSLKEMVRNIKESGFATDIEEKDMGERLEIIIRIEKQAGA